MIVTIDRRKLFGGVIILMVLTALATYGATVYFIQPRPLASQSPARPYPEFERLYAVYDYIRDNYVDKVDTAKLVDGAVDGLVRSLGDPYTVYLDARDYKELMIHTRGTFGGIGITVIEKNGYITVVSPLKGTPGERAGLKPGDRIVKVDGRDITGTPLEQAIELMRGEVGTSVTLTILPVGSETTREVTVTRARIEYPTVDSKMLDGGIGYIQVYSFTETTASNLRKALKGLRQKHIKGLILDLRHNPGGRLDSVLEVAELFVPRGPVVHIVERSGARETLSSNSSGLGLPLVVLVDGGSASAAEILAGAIKDRGVGTLVGTRTFGKASVQSLFNLDGGTGVKVTTARYLTPNGNFIDKIGIVPDVPVDLPEAPPEEKRDEAVDAQLEKAVEVLKAKL